MDSLRYGMVSLALGVIVVWAGENMFWIVPPAGLTPADLFMTVIAYAIACGVALSMVIGSGVGGLSAAFLGGAVMGYVAEGVIVATIYQPPVYFYWVWTPLAWHALISGGIVLGIGRCGAVLGPWRMALIWSGLGLGFAYWAQYWPSVTVGTLPGIGTLLVYLVGFGALAVLAHGGLDRVGHLPRPPTVVLWIAPGIAVLIWGAQTVAEMNPVRLLLPVTLALIWWIMRRLGQGAGQVPLGAPVPLWQHGLMLLAPLIVVGLAPLVWGQGRGTFEANGIVAGITGLVSLGWLVRLIWRAARA